MRAQRTARTQEKNRGREEVRQLVTRPIEPVELGLLGASQVARLDRYRTEHGQTKSTQMWVVISRLATELSAEAFLWARRDQWGIENRLHYVLDVSGDEDRRLQVRTLKGLCVLACLSRISVALWRHCRRDMKGQWSYYRWREEQKARPGPLLRLLRRPVGPLAR